jgi:starch synthase
LLEDLARKYSDRFAACLGFDDELAHQIEAGADLFLMPSLFEPCGLNQLYSLVHGTVPIVRSTGGLADTVVDANPRTLADGTANGFTFIEPTSQALWQAIERALSLWPDREAWARLMRNGMNADWSWDRSASEYTRLYEEIGRNVRP